MAAQPPPISSAITSGSAFGTNPQGDDNGILSAFLPVTGLSKVGVKDININPLQAAGQTGVKPLSKGPFGDLSGLLESDTLKNPFAAHTAAKEQNGSGAVPHNPLPTGTGGCPTVENAAQGAFKAGMTPSSSPNIVLNKLGTLAPQETPPTGPTGRKEFSVYAQGA
jgi:hypothetical protein